MAKTLSITIPEDLFNRLQAVKESLNVSGVCQEAIASAVKIEELRKEGGDNMEAVIERLREEKKTHAEEYYAEGFEEGLRLGKELDYVTLLNIVMDEDPFYVLDHLEYEVKDLRADNPRFDEEAYVEGMVEGIKEFYMQVEGDL
jgi:post-segregation antitoxin (ccd killing protein)